MSVTRSLVALLDRPGGRHILAALTNAYARHRLHVPVSVEFDGFWIRRFADRALVDDTRYSYYADTLSGSMAEWETYQRAARDWYLWQAHVDAGDTVLDVGAGIGTDTIAFAHAVGPGGRVLAIEAHPVTFRRLVRMCELHGLNQVVPVFAAVTDRAGPVFIEDSDRHLANRISTAGTGTQVAGLTLDQLAERHGIGDVALLKINIEGAERLAIQGATAIIGRTRSVCICCHDFRARGPDDDWFRTRSLVTDWLVQHGFGIHMRPDHPRRFVRDHVCGVRPVAGAAHSH